MWRTREPLLQYPESNIRDTDHQRNTLAHLQRMTRRARPQATYHGLERTLHQCGHDDPHRCATSRNVEMVILSYDGEEVFVRKL